MAKRILIVDDSAGVRQVRSSALSGAGYQVLEAADGQDALAKLAAGRVHLVITDLHGPNLDGVGLIRTVRENVVQRFTPVVMITGESEAEEMEQGKAAGATGWIVRPFTPDQLLAVVRRVIGS
jgi:two-component system chemotaxis response regulator CheY